MLAQIKNYPQRVFGLILDIVFPKTCLGCGVFTNSNVDADYICKKCFGRICLTNSFECIGCKRQTQFGLTCAFCKKENPTDQLFIATDLSDPLIEKMLKAYKYKFIPEISKPLSAVARRCIKKLLSKGFNVFEDNPLLIPVPLHARRLNWRGFNQAELLAKNIADSYHVSYTNDVLIRVVNPKHQADIKNREERLCNVKNNFVVRDSQLIKDRTVVLIDDICTTGATLNECAKVLKNPSAGGGAKRVIGFVVARGRFKHHPNF